jgi:hypothetical protein
MTQAPVRGARGEMVAQTVSLRLVPGRTLPVLNFLLSVAEVQPHWEERR